MKRDEEMEKLLSIWHDLMNKEQVNSKRMDSIEQTLQDMKIETEEAFLNKDIFKRYECIRKKIFLQIEEKRKVLEFQESIKVEEKGKKELKGFIQEVNNINGDEFVFIFSGTTFIQKVKGNRPIRMALEYEKQGVPVLFSYWRWHMSEFVEPHERRLILQLPLDQIMKCLLEIIKAPIQKKYKTFILSFPYPPTTKYLEVFKLYGWKVIYDIRDDWEEFHKINQAKWYEKAHEIYAIEKADYTMAVSKPLTQKFLSHTNKFIDLVPNALDNDFFTSIKNQVQRNKIGYVGHLTAGWFDWNALIDVIQALPEYNFEIIGHSMPNYIDLLPPNAVYLGPKDFQEVQEYVKEWKIGLIPFKINELTKGIDPIKVYEYLGMGLKVVSFMMPQILDYPEVKIAYTTEQFIEKIKEAMNEDFNQEVVDGFLKSNTWTSRIEDLRRWR